jgi:ABC-type uncharacterized transport system involved in gliding motility auxiliary subunit
MSSKWRRLVDVLGPLGFVVIVGSRWASREGRELPGGSELYLILGVGLVLAHLVLRWQSLFGRVGQRQVRYGTNLVVLVVTVLGILGTVNYLVARNTKRWDLTEDQRFSLAPQTKEVLASLEEDAKITYFERETEASVAAQDRLREYQAASPRVQVEYVDPWKSPAKAREYEITTLPALVVEYRGRREKISNESEQDITNALIKVTREGTKTVCFVEGEGERDLDEFENQGYSSARSALERSQYETRTVFLVRERQVPSDCTVAVVAGPQTDLLDTAVEALRRHVAAGGKLMVMMEPDLDAPQPSLKALLGEWNIVAGDDVVVDASGVGQIFGTGPITPLVVDYPYHEITKDFQVMTAFHTARSMTAGDGSMEGVSAQNLLRTSQASWAETDLSLANVEMNEGVDTLGPISVAAVATVTVPDADDETDEAAEPAPTEESEAEEPAEPTEESEAAKPEGRVVAFGDADFASNALLSFQGNQDLFLNAVAWLSQDTELISIRPKEPKDQRMVLTPSQQSNVRNMALIYLPLFFVLLGVASWWRRRG